MIVEAALVNNKLKLNHVRVRLRLTQKQVAERAGVGRRVVIRAENGQTISLMSAYAILDVLNAARAEIGQPQLDINDLIWNVEE